MSKRISTVARSLRFCVAALLLFTVSVAAKAHDFSATNDDGILIYYNVLSSTDKTCEVTYNSSTGIIVMYSGKVNIPQTVYYSGTAYTVTSIGSYAFEYCSGLTEVTIPESVTSIGECAFYQCTGLTQLEVAEDNECYCSVDGVLYSKDMTTLIQFPAASAVTLYKIPNSVTEIGAYAFYYCKGLTEVTIGKSVTSIGSYAFRNCTALESITSLNPEPPTCYDSNVFYNVPTSTCILYVQEGSLEAYSTASQWKDFLNIEEIQIVSTKVQTYEATEVTYSSALLRGVVTLEEEEVLEQGFKYWAEGGDVQTITSPDLIMAVTLTGLEDGVTYTYRAYAITEDYPIYGEEMTFTTIKAPTVQTYEVTEITENSALLKGFVTAGNEDVLGQGFEYWAEGGEIQTVAMSDQMMAVTVSGLLSGTTYTCRAYAITESGTTYGEEVSFTTLGTATVTPPTVQTYSATEISENSATLNGAVTAGSEEVTGQGFEYWTASNDVQTVATAGGSLSVTVTGLASNTKYTYRAYAITESGTTYGEEETFTTLEIIVTPPTVQTYEVTEITENSALLKGFVTAGTEDVVEQGFEYWTAGGEIQTVAMSEQLMAVTVTGLLSGTTYTCRAYAMTESGTTYGEEESFTTLEVTDGINDATANGKDVVAGYYSSDGKQVPALQRGINIIRYSDGSARKVLVK